MIRNVLIGIATTLIISLLTWIAVNTMQVPVMNDKLDGISEQLGRHDELIEQEMIKTAVLQEQVRELKRKQDKK